MEWLVPLILLIGIVFFFSARKREKSPTAFPYEIQDPVFSPAERSFFGVLNLACADAAVVFGKVRVADVLRPTKGLGRSDWQKAFNRISAKHFDYVICQPGNLAVIAVVELDDRSHSRKDRRDRDVLLDGACGSAGLKLYRFKVRSEYSIGEVRDVLFPAKIVD